MILLLELLVGKFKFETLLDLGPNQANKCTLQATTATSAEDDMFLSKSRYFLMPPYQQNNLQGLFP